MIVPGKLGAHKKECIRCHSADSIKDLCRIGRRLFIGWISSANEMEQVSALFQITDEHERQLIIELAGLDHLYIGLDNLKKLNS